MNEDEFARRFRAADPAGPRRDGALAPQQRALMERIMAEPVAPTPPPLKSRPARARWSLAAVPLGAMAVLAVIFGFFGPFPTAPTYAYGPAPLAYDSVDDSLEDIVRTAQQQLSTRQQVTAPERRSSSVAWNLVINDSGEPEEVSFINPLTRELAWAEDLSGTRVIREGEPYPVDDPNYAPATSVAAGTTLYEEEFAAGEYLANLPDAGNLDEAYARELFALYAPFDTDTPGDAMWAVGDLLDEWTLTDTQHSHILETLLAYTNMTVLGTTEDRLGRPVIGVQGASSGGYLSTLFISTETGRIVGVESAVGSTDAALQVPVGTITSYTLWKDPQ